MLETTTQTEVDRKGTKPDTINQDFTSDFQDKTEDEVCHLIRKWIERNGRSGGISNRWIAVLDGKSVEDGTLLMYYAMKKSYWDETHKVELESGVDAGTIPVPGHARVCEDGCIWWKWRVPFRFGFYFWNSITSCGMEVLELYCRPGYLRADGAVDMDTCSGIIEGDIEDPMGRM